MRTVLASTTTGRSCVLGLLLVCAVHGGALAQSACDTTWDGDRLAERARGFDAESTMRLTDSRRQPRAEVTAAQILAFHEAKEAIARQLQRSPQFVICDGRDPNAFATRVDSGDVMGVTVGMLKLVNGDRDMAAEVVGHEFAHHVKDHAGAARSRQKMLALVGLLAGIALESRVQRKNGPSGLGLDLGLLGANLVSRKFDRDQEREADELGLQYLVEAGFSPQGAVRMAQRMGQLGQSGSGLFLDTHPGWQERGELLQRLIASSPAAQQALARTGPYTQLASLTPRPANQAPQVAQLLPTYETTDAERSYTEGMAALQRGDFAVALRDMRAAARAGHAPAQYVAGWLFTSGIGGLPKNDVEGVRMYTLAADQGNHNAMTNLAVLYASGASGLPQDPAEALRLLRKASELGNLQAMKKLADAHFNGWLGLDKDPAAALPLYRQASERGLADATATLSVYHLRGLAGLPRDEVQALKMTQVAAAQGNAISQFAIGQMHATGTGLPKDPMEAARYYRAAADQGHAQAQVALGLALLGGQGVARDDAEAVRLFQAAADQGFSRAQVNLGYMHENGRGVPQSWSEALRWYRLAADQGNPVGQTNMGLAYAGGQGVARDETEAVRWFRLAAAQGFEFARNELKKRNLLN